MRQLSASAGGAPVPPAPPAPPADVPAALVPAMGAVVPPEPARGGVVPPLFACVPAVLLVVPAMAFGCEPPDPETVLFTPAPPRLFLSLSPLLQAAARPIDEQNEIAKS